MCNPLGHIDTSRCTPLTRIPDFTAGRVAATPSARLWMINTLDLIVVPTRDCATIEVAQHLFNTGLQMPKQHWKGLPANCKPAKYIKQIKLSD